MSHPSSAAGPKRASGVVIELSAAIVTLAEESPKILLVQGFPQPGLPCGQFDPGGHRTFEEGLRTWVREQTGLPLGYVEQLYTFGDQFRDPQERQGGPRPISVGYLALVRQTVLKNPAEALWSDWYRHFPWEDWRGGPPPIIDSLIAPNLERWCEAAKAKPERQERRHRINLTFGLGGAAWDYDRILERYELLYESGFVMEAAIDGRITPSSDTSAAQARNGTPLTKDHRRILATAMGRLRAKIKYRPVIFEMMPPSFTLLQLQRAVEALSGTRLHKQNFRRLVAHEGMVEPTGQISSQTGGRPAELFRFRREVVLERPAPGVRLPARARKRSR